MSRTSKFSNEKYIKHQNIYEKHSILTKENSNYRIITKNLVYIIGLSDSISEKGILIKYEYLGQYGKITKIVINKKKAYNLNNRFGPSFSAYVTYSSPEEASIAILSLDNIIVENHLIRASFGTTKYCQFFLKGLECNNKDCVYLHKKAKEEDIIKRDELSSNKNLFYIQQLYAIKIANIYNPDVKKKIMAFANKSANSVFPSPDQIYENEVVIENQPKNNIVGSCKNSKHKNYLNNNNNNKNNNSNNNNNNKNNNNNNNSNNNNNNNNKKEEKNSTLKNNNNNLLSKIPPISKLIINKNNNKDNENMSSTTSSSLTSKSSETFLYNSIFNSKSKSRFSFVNENIKEDKNNNNNNNINNNLAIKNTQEGIFIPEFIKKINDKACRMIILTKFFNKNNFIDDRFLYNDEFNYNYFINESNNINNNNNNNNKVNINNNNNNNCVILEKKLSVNEDDINWKKYINKTYENNKKYLKNKKKYKDEFIGDFEKINNFILKKKV